MITRRSLLGIGASSFAALATTSLAMPSKTKPQTLAFYGPPAGPSVTLAVVANKRLIVENSVRRATFETYLNPDLLRANFISGNWQAAIAPSYVAANLANKGLPVKLLNIMSNGLLYLLSFDGSIAKAQDLVGETVGMFYRNDMPDLVFARIMREQGLKVGSDYQVRYTGSPIEALQLLLSGRIKHCVLPEPAATAALSKAKKLGKQLHRSLDLAREWSALSRSRMGQPLAGLMLHEALIERDPGLVDALQQGCVQGTRWVVKNPDEAAGIAADTMPLPAKLIAQSIPFSRLVAERAKDIRADLEAFYTDLAETNPAIIGGKLPQKTFYL